MLTSAGFFQMDCIAVTTAQWIWDLIGPLLGLLALSLLLVWLVLTYRARLLQAWETRHINALKRRFARLLGMTSAPGVAQHSATGYPQSITSTILCPIRPVHKMCAMQHVCRNG